MVKNLPASSGDTEMLVQSLGREDPLEQKMGKYSVFLPGNFHGQRSPLFWGFSLLQFSQL